MKILAIDTSCCVATVSIIDELQTIAEFTINNNHTHSQHIMCMIEDIFKNAKMDISCIDYIACSIGPGSFTGLRIGIATAKGLAHALNKKIVPVPTLQALAYNIFDNSKLIVPIMNCRRNSVYTAFYEWQNNIPIPILECIQENIDKVIYNLLEYKKPVIFCGDAVLLFKDKIINAGFEIAPSNLIMPKASSVGSLAFKILKTKLVHYSDLKAFYVKPTQAEREYDEKIKIVLD